MNTETQTILKDILAIPSELSSIGAIELVGPLKAIAAHLLAQLPKPVEAEVHGIATEVASVAPIVEALTPNTEIKSVESEVAEVAQVVETDTVAS